MSVWTGFTFLANVFGGESNRCLPKVFLASSAKSVCFSAKFFLGGTCWCLLGLSSRVSNIFLVNSTNVCLKCLPLLVCQCLLVGHLGSCWGGLAGGFHACCPVSLNSPIHRDWGLSLTLYHCLSECFPCFWWSWYPIFFSLWRMPTGCLPLGLPRFCFKTYQIFFWSSLTLFFIKTVQVQQIASKDTDRSWVGFKDSTGKHKLILTNYLK